MVLTQLADCSCVKTKALRMGFLRPLLICLAVASKKHRAMKEAVADAAVALKVGVIELKGDKEEEVRLARTEALPLLKEALKVTQIETVKERLAAVVEQPSMVGKQ